MVTIYDVAKIANVSPMTVSRVINNTGRISPQTRARIKRILDELNYVPNHTARSLVLQQTKVLFLLITDITNPFYTTLSRGAEDAARKNGYRLLFGNSDETIDKEGEYINTILSSRVDGVLLAPAGDASLPNLQRLIAQDVPFVLLDREVPGIDADLILGDSKEGARTLVDHLYQLGHRRIAMVNGASTISSARQRLQGFLEGMKLNDLKVEESYLHESSFKALDDDSNIEAWLKQMEPFPTAIIAGNNVLAIQSIRTLHRLGFRVPDDISVVGFDDLGPYSEIDPFLTVISQQAYQFGYIGAQMLIDRLQNREHNEPLKKIVLPSELHVHRSTSKIN